MIKVEGLTKQIPGGPTILSNLSFELEAGKFVVIGGSSGSGKTTLLRCLGLQTAWTKGAYYVNGEDVLRKGLSGKMKIRREFAYLEQKPELYPNKTALKNVIIGARNQVPLWRRVTGMVRSDDYMGAMDTLEKVGLIDKAHTKGSKLSGGERQRVAVARALAHGATAILADEPVSGLDPHAADQVLADLKQLAAQQNVLIVAVLHQVDLAEKYADQFIGLGDGGKIVLNIRGRKLTMREKQLL